MVTTRRREFPDRGRNDIVRHGEHVQPQLYRGEARGPARVRDDVQLVTRVPLALRKQVVLAALAAEVHMKTWITAALEEHLAAVNGPAEGA